MSEHQRIFAGLAGGKKYFHGENGKLYDEAGVEQPEKLATVLKANFPPPPKPISVPNPAQGRAPPQQPVITTATSGTPATPPPPAQPTPARPQQQTTPDIAPPSNSGPGMASTLAVGLLKLAFPDIYNTAKKYRRIINKTKKKKPSGTVASSRREKKASDKKRNEKELSLNIQATASLVRSNGELLRQQLTKQEETIELLEKIAHKAGGGGHAITEGIIGAQIFGIVKRFIVPALGAVLGVGVAGALAYHYLKPGEKKGNEQPPDDTPPGPVERLTDALTPDTRKPKERAADQAKKYDRWGKYVGPVPGLGATNKETPAIAEAKNKKPDNKVVEIKAANITFEAKTIVLDAKTLTINGTSSSTSSTVIGGGAAATGGNQRPQSTTPQQPGSTGDSGGGSPDKLPNGEPRSYVSDGSTPAGSVFKPDVVTPSSPGSDNPKAPGYGGITGGTGAVQFDGGRPYSPKAMGTAEAIRKNDISPTQSFKPTKSLVTASGKDPKGEIKEGANNPRLAESRAGFFEHLDKNPETKANVIRAALNEGGERGLQANIEQFINYGQSRGMKNFQQVLDSGFFGSKYKWQKNLTAQNVQLAEKAFQAVQTGSNKIGYRNDQGMEGDPNFDKERNDPRYRQKNIDGAFFADHPVVGTGWAAQQMEADKQWNKTHPKQDAKLSTATNTKGLVGGTLTSDMMSSRSVTDMKGMGGIAQAQNAMDDKPIDDAIKQSLAPFVKERAKAARGEYDIQPDYGIRPTLSPPTKFTDELQQRALDEEADKHNFGWLWKHGPEGRNRKQQLSVDPWQSEPGWDKPIDKIPESPPAIPDYSTSSLDTSENHASSSLHDDPPEKTEGSRAKITEIVNGPKKPAQIRPIDLDKYYPQYPKSDYNGQTIGITVT